MQVLIRKIVTKNLFIIVTKVVIICYICGIFLPLRSKMGLNETLFAEKKAEEGEFAFVEIKMKNQNKQIYNYENR